METESVFGISYVCYLNESAEVVNELPAFATDTGMLLALYKNMQLLRTFDAKAYALQRTGKMGTYPAALGQEAVGIGYGSCLTLDDVLVPYYRSTGAIIMHGTRLHELLLYWSGDERGSDYEDPKARHDFPISITIASQLLHAAGVATAINLKKQKHRAVVTELGEGGTSEGDFYEALNVAGVWQLPLVIMVNNNQWAISVPSETQTHCETFAQKALAAGVEGLRVDGNDVIAVKAATENALNKARAGGGPTLIEAITYRLCDHTTADDARRYHDQSEYDQAWEKEPLKRLAKYLSKKGVFNEKIKEQIEKDCENEVERAVEVMLAREPLKTEDMFDYLYATLPEKTQLQRLEAMKRSA